MENISPNLSLFASRPGVIINPEWLELLISYLHDFKDVRSIEVLLCRICQVRITISEHSLQVTSSGRTNKP